MGFESSFIGTKMSQEQVNVSWQTYSNHLNEMMKNLLESSDAADVTLVCDDRTKFKAHKFVLKACSPVFKSIMTDLSQNESVIYLRGVQAQEMKPILQYLYLGQATVCENRVNEFLNVAESLEIIEIIEGMDYSVLESLEEIPEFSHISNENPDLQDNSLDSNKKYNQTNTQISKIEKNIQNIRKEETAKYQCNKCDKKYFHKEALSRHNRSVHNGIKHQCHNCPKAFSSKSHLVRHFRALHDEESHLAKNTV